MTQIQIFIIKLTFPVTYLLCPEELLSEHQYKLPSENPSKKKKKKKKGTLLWQTMAEHVSTFNPDQSTFKRESNSVSF